MKVTRIIEFLSALDAENDMEMTVEDDHVVFSIHKECVTRRIGFYRQQFEVLKNVLDFKE